MTPHNINKTRKQDQNLAWKLALNLLTEYPHLQNCTFRLLKVYFVTDLFKILAAKRLRNKLTPRRIFKTKKIVALFILGFGILLLTQGMFPNIYEKNKEKLEKISPIKKKN